MLSEKVAGNFTSRGQDNLSSASIKSKLYIKDFAVTDPIEEILLAMLMDLRAAKHGI